MLKNSPEHTARGQKLFLLGASHNPFPLDSYNQPARYRSRITSVTLKSPMKFDTHHDILFCGDIDGTSLTPLDVYSRISASVTVKPTVSCKFASFPFDFSIAHIMVCVCVCVCMYVLRQTEMVDAKNNHCQSLSL